MHFEESIQGALRNEALHWELPRSLDARIRLAFREQTMQKSLKSYRSKKMIISLIAACLVIGPSTVFAFTSLADDIYSSFDNLKKELISVSMQEYSAFGMKLSGAQSQLGTVEYTKFIKMIKELTALRVTYGKSFIIDDTLMSADQRDKYKNLLSDLQPYFDKLNGQLSSRDVLSHIDFDAYMEATIVLQRIASQLGESKGYVLPDKVPADKKEAYDQANKILKQVKEKTEVKSIGNIK